MQQAKRTVMRRATAITLVGALFGTTAALFANNVSAQSFPSRPVRVIVPYGAGTGLDVIVRLITEPIGKELKQPVVVENRLGAGGVVGTQAVAISPPDGLTLVAVPSSHTTVSLVTKNVPFHPANDFAGITTLAENPLVLVIARSKNIPSVADLVAAAKAKPGALTFASAGTGTSTHISSEKVRIAGGFEAMHVGAAEWRELLDRDGDRNEPSAPQHLGGPVERRIGRCGWRRLTRRPFDPQDLGKRAGHHHTLIHPAAVSKIPLITAGVSGRFLLSPRRPHLESASRVPGVCSPARRRRDGQPVRLDNAPAGGRGARPIRRAACLRDRFGPPHAREAH